ncbi:MAG: hypothetical protein ACK4ZN_02710 [Oceanibaculum sp.]
MESRNNDWLKSQLHRIETEVKNWPQGIEESYNSSDKILTLEAVTPKESPKSAAEDSNK